MLCGFPYDWGDGWFTRPCPRCGTYADTFHPQEYLWTFIRAQGGLAEAAQRLELKQTTLERWLKEGLRPGSWRFLRGRVRKILLANPNARGTFSAPGRPKGERR